MSAIETAEVVTTGDRVRVIRRRGITSDDAIMDALEAAGYFVIGTPQSFRWRKPESRRFTKPAPDQVFLVNDAGACTAVLPGPYFYAHYRIIGDAR